MSQSSFRELFVGSPLQHSQWAPTTAMDENGKVLAGHSRSVLGAPSDLTWSNHFDGSTGLGLMANLPTRTAKFGCIDVDPKTLEGKGLHVAHTVHDVLQAKGLPFVVTVSKSKGAHAWIFFPHEEPVEQVNKLLRRIAEALGFEKMFGDVTTVDVFPTLGGHSQKIGAHTAPYVSLPYIEFGERRAVDGTGGFLSLDQFVEYAQLHCIITLPELKRIAAISIPEYEETDTASGRRAHTLIDMLKQGPPCYETMMAEGGIARGEGIANKSLAHLSSRLRTMLPDDWEEVMYEVGYGMDPPFSAKETAAVIGSQKRGEFGLLCTDDAVVGKHCKKTECGKRKYGYKLMATAAPARAVLTVKEVICLAAHEADGLKEYSYQWEFEEFPGRNMTLSASEQNSVRDFLFNVHIKFSTMWQMTPDDYTKYLAWIYAQKGTLYKQLTMSYDQSQTGQFEKSMISAMELAVHNPEDAVPRKLFKRGHCYYCPKTGVLQIGGPLITRVKKGMDIKQIDIFQLIKRSRLTEPGTSVTIERGIPDNTNDDVITITPRLASKMYDGEPGWFEVKSNEKVPEVF